jgi:lauroyl/myristoyl acyltransferase
MAPAFLRRDRERPGCYVIHIGEPIEIDGTMRSARERLRLLTSRAQRALEEEIRRRPEEWLWIHRRWKRSSDGGDIYHLRHRRPPRRLKTEEIAGGMRRRTPLTGQR